MGRRRVVVHFIHEFERMVAENLLENPTVSRSFAVGDIDESEILELRRYGLVLGYVGASEPPPARDGDAWYLVTVPGGLDVSRRRRLEEIGVELGGVGNACYAAAMGPSQVEALRAMEFVSGVRRLE